jgi:hypothetical protein
VYSAKAAQLSSHGEQQNATSGLPTNDSQCEFDFFDHTGSMGRASIPKWDTRRSQARCRMVNVKIYKNEKEHGIQQTVGKLPSESDFALPSERSTISALTVLVFAAHVGLGRASDGAAIQGVKRRVKADQ